MRVNVQSDAEEKGWWAGDLLSRSLFAPLIPPYKWLLYLEAVEFSLVNAESQANLTTV